MGIIRFLFKKPILFKQLAEETELSTLDNFIPTTVVTKKDPNYAKSFWGNFFSIRPFEESFHQIRDFQEFIEAMPFDGDVFLPSKKIKVTLPKDKIAEKIQETFDRHFPKRNLFYYSATRSEEGEWVGFHFFLGETDDYFMGFYFVGERYS